ncbi:MAG: PAS-domain containing protein, partial [Gemmatimonadetes bacterium]|nr:PAS-domain containing protein [Gemmatimonadota bacterium]
MSEAYVPIMVHGRFMGAIEVYVDMSPQAVRYRHSADYVLAGLLLLLIAIGSICGIVVWRNIRDRDRELREVVESREAALGAEQALRESEARFRAVVDNSPTKIHIKDAEGRYILVNPEAERLFGFTDEEARGKNSYDIFPKDVADAFTAHDRAVMESGETVEEEEQFTCEDGEHTYLTVKFPVPDGRGGISGIAAIGTDITERKRAEREIARQSALLGTTFENMSQGICVHDADLKLAAFNLRYIELRGYPRGFIRLGMPLEEIVRFNAERGEYGPGDMEELVRERISFTRLGKKVGYERAGVDGRIVAFHREPMPGGGYVSTFTDITARKKSEKALIRQSALLEASLESMSQGIVVYDSDLKVRAFNSKYIELQDFPKGLVRVGAPMEEIFRFQAERDDYGPGDVEAHVRERAKSRRSGAAAARLERSLPNGKVVSARREPMPDGGYVTTYTDITEEKRAEKEIAEKSALLETTFENIAHGFAVYDADLKVVAFNRQFAEMMDYPPGLIEVGRGVEDILRFKAERGDYGPCDVAAKVEERTCAIRRGEGHQRELTLPDGRVIAIRRDPMPDGGSVTCYTDITEAKRAEKALREGEELLRTVVDNLPVGVSLKDREGRYELINKQYTTWYGLTNDEARGRAPDEILDEHAETRAGRARQHRDVLASGKVVTREDEKRRADGTLHFVVIKKFPVVDSHGDITSVGSVSVDITERRRAEEEIAEKSTLLETTFESMSQGLSVFDADLKLVAFNEWYVNMWRFPEGFIRLGMPFEEIARFKAERGDYGSGDVEELMKRPIEAMRQGKPWRDKCGAPSGAVFEFHRDPMPGGGVINTFTDITERKRVEAELIQSAKLATLGEIAAGMVHELSQPLNIIRFAAEGSVLRMEKGTFGAEDQKRQFETIDSQCGRMAKIIDNMRVFSRKDDAAEEIFDPAESVKTAVDLIEAQFRADGIDISTELPRRASPVHGCMVRLEQVIINLLTNAHDSIVEKRETGAAGS